MSEYYVIKRLKCKCICGNINIKYGTKLNEKDNIISFDDGRVICYSTSSIAHNYMSSNYDGNWELRGKLISEIISKLTINPNSYDEKPSKRWNLLWNDEYSSKFRKLEYNDYWLWNHYFYNATIDDLTYILNLINKVN